MLPTGGSVAFSSSLLTGIDEDGEGAALFVLIVLLVDVVEVVVVVSWLLVSAFEDASVDDRSVSTLFTRLPVGITRLLAGTLPSL